MKFLQVKKKYKEKYRDWFFDKQRKLGQNQKLSYKNFSTDKVASNNATAFKMSILKSNFSKSARK